MGRPDTPWWFGIAAIGVLVLAGCSASKQASPGPSKSPVVKAAMVTDSGGIDDRSFNASAWEGLKRAKSELGVEVRYVESREQSDYKTNLGALADQGNDLVFAIGYLMEDALKEVAPRYPNTRFVIIDGSAPKLGNCLAVKFREEEGSFLAGFVAASVSKSGTLGFIGGMEGPLIKKFECGYRAGALTARPDITVLVKYVGSWTDVAKGKEFARTAIQQGADVLFHAAGKSGLGVLDAAAEAPGQVYGIGVDRDQDDEHPGRVLTSMMKDVEGAVYRCVKDQVEGKWQSGERIMGVKEEGLKLSPMRYTRKAVSDEAMRKLDIVRSRIADGTLVVPATEDALRAFKPPQL
ncbi:MAG: BMP family ABC transporter substrate-binding protein [Chthonomonadales bacterium]|nr:BMP family ABC transporter substrate-binding protein [Chthonomonadales bacterium]